MLVAGQAQAQPRALGQQRLPHYQHRDRQVPGHARQSWWHNDLQVYQRRPSGKILLSLHFVRQVIIAIMHQQWPLTHLKSQQQQQQLGD